MNSNSKKRKRIRHLITLLLISAFTILVAFKMIMPNKKTVFILNYAPMTIMTASMEPNYKTNSFIIIKKESIDKISIGDVIVFESNALNGGLAFHRITRITDEGFYTKGDNNSHEDNQLITADTYIGKCVFHTNLFARYLTMIKMPAGFIMFLLIPAIAIGLFGYAMKKLLLVKRRRNYENLL